jgi:N-acetyltransferase 10
MKKKIDDRIRVLIENAIKKRHRTMFIIIGDRGRDQVVNLHYLLSRSELKKRPSVLWCYKKELGFSSHKKKRLKQIKQLQRKGLFDNEVDDPFELFATTTDIKYTYYKDTDKILGNTYGMVVLQDFEGITPNVMCRTMETVEGGKRNPLKFARWYHCIAL